MPELQSGNQEWVESVESQIRENPNYRYDGHWVSPERHVGLRQIRDSWLRPYISPDKVVLEIGTGRGQWTQHMLAARHVYCADVEPLQMAHLHDRFGICPNLTFVETCSGKMSGIPRKSLDFVFLSADQDSLDLRDIGTYLGALKPLLDTRSDMVIQYEELSRAAVEELLWTHGFLVVRHETDSVLNRTLIHCRVDLGQGVEPWPIRCSARIRLMAWPAYRSAADLTRLLHTHRRRLVNRDGICLCLRFDPEVDGPKDEVLKILNAVYPQVLGESDLRVILLDEEVAESSWPRLGAAVHALIDLPSSGSGIRKSFSEAMTIPHIWTSSELESVVSDLIGCAN